MKVDGFVPGNENVDLRIVRQGLTVATAASLSARAQVLPAALFTSKVDIFVPGNENVDLRVGHQGLLDRMHNERECCEFICEGAGSAPLFFVRRKDDGIVLETKNVDL